MTKPFFYSDKEMLVTEIPDQQSIFTSKFFRLIPKMLPEIGFPKNAWDYSDSDFIKLINNYSALFAEAFTGIGCILGEHEFKIDSTNFALAKAGYYTAAEGEKMPNYFPTPELMEALNGTELKWIDAEIFTHLPDAFTIRFPVKNQFRMLMGDGWHSLDDFMLMRAKIPILKAHIFACHNEPDPQPEWEAWYWIAQSRSELHKALQNTTYGSFIIKQNTKLDDLMTYIENWSRSTDIKLRDIIAGNDLSETLTEVEAHGDSRFRRDNASYFKAAVESRLNYSDEGYKTYIDSLKMVLKFAILMNTEQFFTQLMPPPGLKPGKLSQKAAEIHEKLRWKWGKRYKVVLPRLKSTENPENEPENLENHHKSPHKHWVMGFFRNQPYGPQRSLRKIKWIPGFWRGTDILQT